MAQAAGSAKELAHLVGVEQVPEGFTGAGVRDVDEQVESADDLAVVVLEGTDVGVEGGRRAVAAALGQKSEELVAAKLIGRLVKMLLDIAQYAYVVNGGGVRIASDLQMVDEAVEWMLKGRALCPKGLKGA